MQHTNVYYTDNYAEKMIFSFIGFLLTPSISDPYIGMDLRKAITRYADRGPYIVYLSQHWKALVERGWRGFVKHTPTLRLRQRPIDKNLMELKEPLSRYVKRALKISSGVPVKAFGISETDFTIYSQPE